MPIFATAVGKNVMKGRPRIVPPPPPPGSYTTFDPTVTKTTTNITLSGGNLTATGPGSSYGHALTVAAVAAGTYYIELDITTLVGTTALLSFGVATPDKNTGTSNGGGGQSWIGGTDHKAVGFYNNGTRWFYNGTIFTSGGSAPTFAAGDRTGLEINVTSGFVKLRTAAGLYATQATFDPGMTGGVCVFVGQDNASVVTLKPDPSTWLYTPTAGYVALPPT